MRILYIVQHFTGPSSTCGSRPYENARRLVQMGHEVTMLCGTSELNSDRDVADARQAGIVFDQSPILYSQRYSYIKRMVVFRQYMQWAICEGKRLPKPDLVFASSTPLTVGEIGRKVAAYHRVPFVFEVRDLWPEVVVGVGALKNPVLRYISYRMARNIYAAADHVVALSQGMKDGVKAWGYPEDRISVIPNCSDTALFGSRTDRDETRKKMGWTGKFVCLYPGVFGAMNNLDYLLDCAKALERMGANDCHIALIGRGAKREHLANRIKEEGISLAALYEPIQKRDMPQLLAAADVGTVSLLPLDCLGSSSPNKFFDFLAAGMPVILNYRGWQADLLKETGAGLFSQPDDPSDMAAQLISLRDDPERVKTMGGIARNLAETRFDRDLLVAKLERILVDVASRGSDKR